MAKPRRGATTLSGILLVDKPAGMTSHDVVDAVRRISGEGRVGHAGTLDPAATGLLLVLVGPATRLSAELMGHDKRYLARIAFGRSTTTDDAEGETIAASEPPPGLADAGLAAEVLAGFVGPQLQRPPRYSAIKRDGRPAYALARAGAEPVLEPRPVTIHAIELLAAAAEGWDIVAEVSKGTFVRALARDVGEAVGCPAHLGALRRLSIGAWSVREALSLDALAAVGFASRLIPV